ncbi:MAG: LPS assembly protein LptD [Alphaproteobacteria bacterium]|nr:LPS assembly protein LptD [Alphaproteobacteria bacterium]
MSETSERTPTWRSAVLAGAAALALLSAGPGADPARAQQAADGVSLSQSEETLFRADEVVHHSELGVTVLRGGVEIAQAGYVLTADTVSYNREADTLTASGDVVLMHPDGTVFFSTYTEITSDGFKNGVIENLRILLTDNARLAASGARRSDGNTTEMARAVYSPCDVCREDPTRAPLWQLKARRVTHDEQDYLLKYEDVWLEVAGVPVLYSPYFQHYDSRVERKSGFLPPSFGSTSGLDRFVQPRYFWAFAPDKDVTIEPVFGSTGDVIAAAQYRQRFNRGFIDADFSLGDLDPVQSSDGDDAIAGEELLDGRKARGHIRAQGAYHIDETWRASLDLNRLTDPSFGRAYPLFGLPDTQAVSRASLEGFRTRNYASAQMLSIQSLRTELPPNYREQDVIPRLAYNGVGAADRFGGRWQFDTEARFLSVENDDDLHRVTVTPGYGLTRTSPWGFKFDGLATVQANGYAIERDFNRSAGDTKTFELEGMVVPKASAQVSYPFVRSGPATTQTITPLMFGVLAPSVDPPDAVRFEDAVTFELDELNVLSHDRLNGNDAIDSGSSVAAGLQYGLGWGDISVDATLARMLSAESNDEMDRRTGLGTFGNDWVGALDVDHVDYGGVSYRFRTDDLGFETARRQILNVALGPTYLRAIGNYTFVDNAVFGDSVADSEFYSAGFEGVQGGWTYSAGVNRDVTADATRSISASLGWFNECVFVKGTFARSFTEVNGRGQTFDGFLVNITLKTLGDYDYLFNLNNDE